jgi:hypothetical protein
MAGKVSIAALMGLAGHTAAMSLSVQSNDTLRALEEGFVSHWRGIPLEEIDPSKYPEFVQWLDKGVDNPGGAATESSVLAQARQDAKGNTGAAHFTNLQAYMDKCQASDPEVVEIPTWMGRMGNRVWQVLNAVRIAEATGRRFVKLPKAGGGLDHHLFGNPQDRLIEITPSVLHRGSCDFVPVSGKMYAWHHDCRFLFFNRCRTTIKERQANYQKYVLPLLNHDVTEKCEDGADDEVTVHIRNGDVALHNDLNPDMRPEHRQPPCAYFHKVIQTGYKGGPFKRVQLVYSTEEPASPCIDDILAKHKDKVVLKPATSLAGDVCHILAAKNLATTMSSFATVLKMMNRGLQRLFFVNMLSSKIMTPEQYDIQMDYYEFKVDELCQVFPEVTSYSVPELYLDEAFFLKFPDEKFVIDNCKNHPKNAAALVRESTTGEAKKSFFKRLFR